MGLNRDKFKNIVGGITTPPATAAQSVTPEAESPRRQEGMPEVGQRHEAVDGQAAGSEATPGEPRRFAQRGRPKGRKDELPAAKGKKVKVSLYLNEALVNDLYEWAHQDRIHPGEMFDRALKRFHELEMKRRNTGKE